MVFVSVCLAAVMVERCDGEKGSWTLLKEEEEGEREEREEGEERKKEEEKVMTAVFSNIHS